MTTRADELRTAGETRQMLDVPPDWHAVKGTDLGDVVLSRNHEVPHGARSRLCCSCCLGLAQD